MAAQYTSYAFGKRCREAGIMPSMGTVGDAYDNAMAEAKMAIFDWLEGWYNAHRRHSSLGYRSPVNYERLALKREATRQ